MSAGSGYDQEVTTFSPDGRVFQVEYAEKAGEKAGTVIGIRCVDGVVMGVEKAVISKLLVPNGNKRIVLTDVYSSLAVAGLVPDGRALGNLARQEAREWLERHDAHIPGHVLAERIAGRVHAATIYWYERPYGVSTLLSTYDEEDGQALYLLKPSGTLTRQWAAAIGKHSQGAKTELEKLDRTKVTCAEAVQTIANIIYKLHDDLRDKEFELELSWQCAATGFKVTTVPDDVAAPAIAKAKAAKERAVMDSDDEDD